MGRLKWLLALVFPTISGFGQDDVAAQYFVEFTDKVALQAFALNNQNDFTIDYRDEDFGIGFIPNQKTTLNIGFNYDILSFSFGFAPRFFAENRDNEGSKMVSFGLMFFPGRFMQRLEYIHQRGMNVEPTNAPAFYWDQLRSTKIGGSTAYLFNRNFSYRASSLQNVKQLRSAGSFAPTLSYYYTNLDGRKVEDLESEVYFVDVAIGPAYYYNWVIGGNFLLASGISLGAGATWTVDESERFTAALYQGSLMLAPGYNGERWFAGAQARIQFASHESDAQTEVGDVLGNFIAFVGYRFDAPEFLSSNVRKIKSKIHKKKLNNVPHPTKQTLAHQRFDPCACSRNHPDAKRFHVPYVHLRRH